MKKNRMSKKTITKKKPDKKPDARNRLMSRELTSIVPFLTSWYKSL